MTLSRLRLAVHALELAALFALAALITVAVRGHAAAAATPRPAPPACASSTPP